MAQRRMFSPDIVESDAFLDMPQSSQCLYFHLGMYADDDGFVNPRKIMRLIGSQEDDLKVLAAKRFVLPFESGVIVIKHWKVNNLVRKDWYRPTQYIEEKSELNQKENGIYTLDAGQGVPVVNDSLTVRPRRLGKDSIGNKDSTSLPAAMDGEYDPQFLSFWEKYPKKVGKGDAARAWAKLRPSQALTARILASVEAHTAESQWKRDNGRFIPNPSTFLTQRRFDDEVQETKSRVIKI